VYLWYDIASFIRPTSHPTQSNNHTHGESGSWLLFTKRDFLSWISTGLAIIGFSQAETNKHIFPRRITGGPVEPENGCFGPIEMHMDQI